MNNIEKKIDDLEITSKEKEEMLKSCDLAIQEEGKISKYIGPIGELNPEFRSAVQTCLSNSISIRTKELQEQKDREMNKLLASEKISIKEQNKEHLLNYKVLEGIKNPIDRINYFIDTVDTTTMRFAHSERYFGIDIDKIDPSVPLTELQFQFPNSDHPKLIGDTYSRFMNENQTLVIGNGGGGLNAVSNSSREVLVNLYKNMLDVNNLVEKIYPTLKTKEEKLNFNSTLENGILQILHINILDRTGLFHNIQIDTDSSWIEREIKRMDLLYKHFKKRWIGEEIIEYAPELKGNEDLHSKFVNNIEKFSEILGEKDFNVLPQTYWSLINLSNIQYVYLKQGNKYVNIDKKTLIDLKLQSPQELNTDLYYKLTDQLKTLEIFLKTSYSTLVVEESSNILGGNSTGSGGDVKVGRKAMKDFIKNSQEDFIEVKQFELSEEDKIKLGFKNEDFRATNKNLQVDPNVIRRLQLPIEKNKHLIELNKYSHIHNRSLIKNIQALYTSQKNLSREELSLILNIPLVFYLNPKYIYNVEKIMTTFAAGGGSGAPIAVELVSYIQKYFKDVKVFSHYHINDEDSVDYQADKITKLWKYALREIHTNSTGVYIISNKLSQKFISSPEGEKLVFKKTGNVVYNFMDRDLGKQFYAEQILQYPFTSEKNTSITQLDAKDINNVTKSKGGIKVFSQTNFNFDNVLSNVNKTSSNNFINDSVETDFNLDLDISDDYIEPYEVNNNFVESKENHSNLVYLDSIIENGMKNFNKQYIIPFKIKNFSGNASDFEFSSYLTSTVQSYVREGIVKYLKNNFGSGGSNAYWRESIRYNSLEKMKNQLNYSSLSIIDSVVSVEMVNDYYYKYAIHKLATPNDQKVLKNWTDSDYDDVNKVKQLECMQNEINLYDLQEIQWLDYDHIFVPPLSPLTEEEKSSMSEEELEERIEKEREIERINKNIILKIPGKLKERAFGYYNQNANLGGNLKPQLDNLLNPSKNVKTPTNEVETETKKGFFGKLKNFFKK